MFAGDCGACDNHDLYSPRHSTAAVSLDPLHRVCAKGRQVGTVLPASEQVLPRVQLLPVHEHSGWQKLKKYALTFDLGFELLHLRVPTQRSAVQAGGAALRRVPALPHLRDVADRSLRRLPSAN